MINKWSLHNFKSIEAEQKLEFRPLTIFTGANSSGKSTVLQSILLVTQTIQSQISSQSVVLNGWFKKYGTYTDVVNKRDDSKNIKIGFSLKEKTDADSSNNRRSLFYDTDVDELDCNFELSSGGKIESLHPALESMHLETFIGRDKKVLDVKKCLTRSAEDLRVIQKMADSFSKSDLEYVVTDSEKNPNGELYASRLPLKYIGVGLSHFLPSYLVGYCLYSDKLKRTLFDYLYSGNSYYNDFKKDETQLICSNIKEKSISVVKEMNEGGIVTDAIVKKYDIINGRFTLSKLQSIFKHASFIDDKKKNYIKQIVDVLDAIPESYVTRKNPIYYHPGINKVDDFFSNQIKYLGPLREEPRSLYPLESSSSSTELGLKGENTAAVFDNNKDKLIDYVDPDSFSNVSNIHLIPQKGILSDVITKWLVYLGVASDIKTNDKGKIGHELKITNDIEGMPQDLTHVGVGVSQILPILVMCLLSNKGDSIILEQPELHLHPKVQSRLADFFVSINALGKQCILETHSEYLINRLRYLVAKTEDSSIAEDTIIYFVEKKEGCSNYRKVIINPYGVIERWPDGFFDESEDLASMIVKAGIEKKRRMMQNKNL